MDSLLDHITTLVQLAGLAMLVFFWYIRQFVKTRLAVFSEGLSFLITLILNATFASVLLLVLVITLFHDFSIEYLRKTGKSVFPIQLFAPSLSKNEEPVRGDKGGLVKIFPQKIIPSDIRADEHEKYSVTHGIEEGQPFYDNHCGLEFTPTNINVENGTAQLMIGPTNVPADSLLPLKTGGLNYRVGGKTHLIFISNAYQVNNRKFIILNILQ